MNLQLLSSKPTTRMRAKRRGSALLASLAVIALVSCGGDESDGSTGPESIDVASTLSPGPPVRTEPGSTEGSPSGELAGPVSTVPAELPEDLVGEIGALDVTGDALPMFGGDTATDAAIGMPAPVMVGTDFDGDPVRVDAALDGPTMLVFLAHWCPVCNAEVPVLNDMRDAGSFPDDLEIVAVSTAVRPDRPNFPPSEWITDVDWTYPVIADGVDMAAGTFTGISAYGLDGFPFIVLIDADGNIAARWTGESSSDEISANIATYLG